MRNLRRAELETGVLTVEVREAAFPLEELCDFAARNNRKRGFLFLSKVLGKHWPAVPTTMRRVHAYLASKLDLGPGPWLFVAMAETATGLGQGIFEAVLDQHAGANALFLHSTRYRIPGRRFFQFEESHCHAPDQYLYEPLDADQRNVFRNAHELVIVDDEISTGSTLCNLVDTYRAHNPGLARVHFVAITNFSGERCAERFSARLGLPVQCVAALHGAFSFQSADEAYAENTAPAFGANVCEPGFVADRLGRFGIDRQLHVPVDDIRGLVAGLEPRLAFWFSVPESSCMSRFGPAWNSRLWGSTWRCRLPLVRRFCRVRASADASFSPTTMAKVSPITCTTSIPVITHVSSFAMKRRRTV